MLRSGPKYSWRNYDGMIGVRWSCMHGKDLLLVGSGFCWRHLSCATMKHLKAPKHLFMTTYQGNFLSFANVSLWHKIFFPWIPTFQSVCIQIWARISAGSRPVSQSVKDLAWHNYHELKSQSGLFPPGEIYVVLTLRTADWRMREVFNKFTSENLPFWTQVSFPEVQKSPKKGLTSSVDWRNPPYPCMD